MPPTTIADTAANLAAARQKLADAVQRAAAACAARQWQLDIVRDWTCDQLHRQPHVTAAMIEGWTAVEEQAA